MAGPSPLRRLTRDEYHHSIQDLFGETSYSADALGGDLKSTSGFAIASLISDTTADALRDVSEQIAAHAVQNSTQI